MYQKEGRTFKGYSRKEGNPTDVEAQWWKEWKEKFWVVDMVSTMVDAKVVSTNNLLQRCTLQSDAWTKSQIIDVFWNKY